jgi:Kef-type K+ transport system membrane component KefB
MGNDVLLLTTLGAVLVLSPVIKGVCHRFGLPVSVGYIVLGLAIGALVKPWVGSSPLFSGAFEVLAQLGVIALLFRVGLRSHTSALVEKLPDASLIWISNVLGSLAIGYVISRYGLQWSIETSLVIATAFSATSIAVSVSVWDEMGKMDSDAGQILLDVAELDDLSAAVFLAILLGTLPALLNGDGDLWLRVGASSFEILAKLALFILACYLFAHFVEAEFTRFNRRLSDTPTTLTISILGAGLVIAAFADYLGFSIAIGALFAGLAFSRDPEAVRTDGNFTSFYDFLTPFFFIHIGMQTDLTVLIEAVDVGLVLFISAALAKFAFTAAPAVATMDRRNSVILGVSMIPRAEIALVVMYECRALDDRIVSAEVFAGMVLLSLATCILSPILLRRMLSTAESN